MALQTYQEIQDAVLDLLGKSDTSTRNRVKTWINMGQSDFVLRELWPFREVTGTITTVQGTQEYTLTDEFSDIDSQNIISVASQNNSGKKLTYWPYNHLRAEYPDFDHSQSAVPERYYIKSGKIGFWPSPNGAYNIDIDYYKIPTALSGDTDETDIPLNYREALMHYALSLEHDFNTDPDLAQKSSNRYEQIVTLARNNLLSQPVDTGNFRILGPADAKDWTGFREEIR